MKNILIPIAASLALVATGAFAKAPPDATGECKDGTYTTSASKEGACSSHGGVKKWMAKEDKADKKAEKSEKADRKDADKKGKADAKTEKAPATAAAAKPADATGECKDGTYTTSATKSGACAGHKGVKTWYETAAPKADAKAAAPKPDAKAAAPAPAKSSTASTPAAAPSPAATSGAASNNASASSKATTPAAQREAAAGGGAGKVWVNTDSKVYHCEKDALYGKTKQGEYMTESQAKASGARPSRGKECTA